MDLVAEKTAIPGTAQTQHDHDAGYQSSTSFDDQDIAKKLVGDFAVAIDPALERRVVRKIDRFLIPAMIVGYGLVYYDKVGSFNRFQISQADHPRQF